MSVTGRFTLQTSDFLVILTFFLNQFSKTFHTIFSVLPRKSQLFFMKTKLLLRGSEIDHFSGNLPWYLLKTFHLSIFKSSNGKIIGENNKFDSISICGYSWTRINGEESGSCRYPVAKALSALNEPIGVCWVKRIGATTLRACVSPLA